MEQDYPNPQIALKIENRQANQKDVQDRNDVCTSLPSLITVADTTRCNLNCIMCQRNSDYLNPGIRPFLKGFPLTRRLVKLYSHHKNKTVMDFNLFEKLAQETFPYLSALCLTVAGEPFMNPNFSAQLEVIESYKVKLLIFTNATLIPSGSLLTKLVDNLFQLVVSIDAATKSTYEQIRKGANFQQVINNIKRFNFAREKIPAEKRPRLIFWFVLMRRNIEEFPEYVRLAHSLGADGIGACHMTVFQKKLEKESLTYHKQLANHYLRQAKDLIDSFGLEALDFPPLFEENNHPGLEEETSHGYNNPCRFPWQEAFIELNGDVYPCCAPDKHGLWMGNILTQPFKEIWNGIRYKSLRRSFKDGYLYPPCRHCYQRLKDKTSDNASIFLRYI